MMLPRVTTILDSVGLRPEFDGISPGVLEAARLRGQEVHAAVEAMTYDYKLDFSADAAPYVNAFCAFLADSKAELIKAEVEVIHPAWNYVGHPDLICWLNGRRGLIDVKTGAADGAAYQVAGYVDAWNACHPEESVAWAAILHLRGDGTYRFEEIAVEGALQVWLAALVIYRARKEMGRV